MLNDVYTLMIQFTVHFIRGVVADSEDTIKASAEALGKHGFINYFGLQVLLFNLISRLIRNLLHSDQILGCRCGVWS